MRPAHFFFSLSHGPNLLGPHIRGPAALAGRHVAGAGCGGDRPDGRDGRPGRVRRDEPGRQAAWLAAARPRPRRRLAASTPGSHGLHAHPGRRPAWDRQGELSRRLPAPSRRVGRPVRHLPALRSDGALPAGRRLLARARRALPGPPRPRPRHYHPPPDGGPARRGAGRDEQGGTRETEGEWAGGRDEQKRAWSGLQL
jgi:hypothetical protein